MTLLRHVTNNIKNNYTDIRNKYNIVIIYTSNKL